MPAPRWLADARAEWCGPVPSTDVSVVIPIWRDPWMVVGANTFTGDLVRRLGYDNLWAQAAFNPGGERHPYLERARIDASGANVIVLPDEPYVFTTDDGPEAFMRTPTRLVSGRLLTCYGPSLLEARSAPGRGMLVEGLLDP